MCKRKRKRKKKKEITGLIVEFNQKAYEFINNCKLLVALTEEEEEEEEEKRRLLSEKNISSAMSSMFS